MEIKGSPLQVRPPNLNEIHSPEFEKYHISKFFTCGGKLFFVLTYLMRQFMDFSGPVKIFSKIFSVKEGGLRPSSEL